MSNDLPKTIEETQAIIRQRQAELRLLHAHKRFMSSQEERAALDAARRESDPPEATVRQTAYLDHNPAEAGFPTTPDGVDMANSHAVAMDTATEVNHAEGQRQAAESAVHGDPQEAAWDADDGGPGGQDAYHPDPARVAFASGAGAAMDGQRGPLLIDFRNISNHRGWNE